MDETLRGVCTASAGPGQGNMNFNIARNGTEYWCLGPFRFEDPLPTPMVGDRLCVRGRWNYDASGSGAITHLVVDSVIIESDLVPAL